MWTCPRCGSVGDELRLSEEAIGCLKCQSFKGRLSHLTSEIKKKTYRSNGIFH